MATTMALQTAQAGCQSIRCRPAQPCRPGRVALACRASQSHSRSQELQLAAAGLAAAALLHSGAANAGVIFEKPQVKKVFQPEVVKKAKQTADAAVQSAEKKAPSLSAPSLPNFGGGLDTNFLVLPAAVVAIGAGGFALSKVDAGWDDFFNAAVIKDSTAYAGYEQDVQAIGKASTKRVKAVAKKANKAVKKPFKK
ncbi:hypothetical protein WJX72_001436 [[Myrmecia] bisecta]|uniref:Uncharacterized protein n=1 Tax=[Myrmecia] bisecta TaxID=41462 RepID=A0AAW1PD13_9CHLO